MLVIIVIKSLFITDTKWPCSEKNKRLDYYSPSTSPLKNHRIRLCLKTLKSLDKTVELYGAKFIEAIAFPLFKFTFKFVPRLHMNNYSKRKVVTCCKAISKNVRRGNKNGLKSLNTIYIYPISISSD